MWQQNQKGFQIQDLERSQNILGSKYMIWIDSNFKNHKAQGLISDYI